ncbi:hypothetical protein V6N13_136376 [Hibiscus sabdariffa]|uniref:USP domain-containing protein n=1 Tax=Hibiscus sabdariffa TaxID=183260 RepID=A0ABR2DP87_9ROSI
MRRWDCLLLWLGYDQKLHCHNCREPRDTSKQPSIKRPPLVPCLHVDRFEHSLVQKASRKIDQYLQFPFSWDMVPYLSSSTIRSRIEYENTDSSAEYNVFAVLGHSGMPESGHYVMYLRLKSFTVLHVTCCSMYRNYFTTKHDDLSSPRRDPCPPSVAHSVDGEVESRPWCRRFHQAKAK